MARFLLAMTLVLCSQAAYSQKTSVTYYDSAWLLTTKDLAKYYRVGIIDTVKYQFYGIVTDYYVTGRPEMKGRFMANIKVDTFYFYYPGGQLKTKGLYLDNYRQGVWISYFENGKVRDKVIFNADFVSAVESYDENGTPKMVNGTGEWGTEYFNGSDIITVTGEYKDTLRHGTWTYHRRSLNTGVVTGARKDKYLECTEIYKNGKFTKGKYYYPGGGHINIESTPYAILAETDKFRKMEDWERTPTLSIESYTYLKFLPKLDTAELKRIERLKYETPEFPGGLAEFFDYVSRDFKCSGTARGTSNNVFVQFVVDTTGYIRRGSVEVVQSDMGPRCRQELVVILENSPQWKPARHMNKNVSMRMKLPIRL